MFSLTRSITYPVTTLAPIPWNVLLYLSAPFIVLAQILLEVFILAPARVTAYFLDLVYPIYVFLGIAVITGAFLGLIARTVTTHAMHAVEPKIETDRKALQM